MAQSFLTDSGINLVIPSAKAEVRVATSNSGLATTGVLMLVGEADSGPDFTQETDLQDDSSFGPDQAADVVAKYKSGPLVDAFKAAAAPANDPAIVGAPSRIILVKTNVSDKAFGTLYKHDDTPYATLADKSFGKFGNQLYFTVSEDTAEAIPTTGSFTWIAPAGTVDLEFRVNGGAAVAPAQLSAGCTPATFVSTINALAGVAATGGAARTMLTVSGTLALAVVSGNAVTITRSVAWETAASVGDSLYIPPSSVLKGDDEDAGGSTHFANAGWYVVTGYNATTRTISATKLADDNAGSLLVLGTVTPPTAVAAVSADATTNVQVFSPVVVTLEAADPSPGIGKSLEIAQLTTGTDLLSRCAYALSTTASTWVSTAASPKLIVSSAEYKCQLNVNRVSDGVQEEMVVGGDIALKIGYDGTTATLTIDDEELTTTVSGGSGQSLSLTLSDFANISDLAQYINAQTGYSCAVGSTVLGQLSATVLDNVTAAGICSTHGEKNGRIKVDAYKFFQKVSGDSGSIEVRALVDGVADADGDVEQAGAGLPAPSDLAYLAGGTKGATTTALVSAAFDELEKVRGNFLIPLFSRDASDDIEDGLTDDASTYEIDSINAAAKTHVLKMSTLKRQRNRQAIVSKNDTFDNQKTAAGEIASFRTAMAFQDVKNVSSTGSIVQFQSWMAATLAAAMQSAGFYRAIFNKGVNCSGIVHAEGDFSDRNDTQMEEALLAGLLPMKRVDTGGFAFVSDQTTYGKDNNFVFNSIQAVYAADVIALTTAQRMEQAFVGQSVADVSAPVALAFLESIMADFLRLKLIAPSSDAPKGFKNAQIRISGPAMIVSIEIKLAGAIYFIPISFLVSQVTQTA